MSRETKNFGLIKAIHVGVNPPLNTKIIWFDDNPGIKIHKYYSVIGAAWTPLGSGATVNGIYTYIGYATSTEGANFTTTKQVTSTYWAVITSTTPITTLTSTLFSGRWTAFDGSGSGGGNFTYVGFADDESGLNFSVEPKYEVACEVCSWVDSFTIKSSTGSFALTPVTEGVRIDFTNLVYGNIIEITLKRGTTLIPNLSQQYFEIIKDAAWSAEGILELNTDANSTDNFVIYNEAGTADSFIKTINGSVARLKVSTNGVSGFSGSIVLKVGSAQCEPSYVIPTNCYEFRKFIGIKTQDMEASIVNAALFNGTWAPLLGSNNYSEEGNYNEQIAKLWEEINNTNSDLLALSISHDAFLSNQTTFNNTIDQTVTNNKTEYDQKMTLLEQADIDSRDRANHTGVQAISTVTNLSVELAKLLQKSDNLTKIIYLPYAEWEAMNTAGTLDPAIIYLTPKTV